jgi:hypothetical protein
MDGFREPTWGSRSAARVPHSQNEFTIQQFHESLKSSTADSVQKLVVRCNLTLPHSDRGYSSNVAPGLKRSFLNFWTRHVTISCISQDYDKFIECYLLAFVFVEDTLVSIAEYDRRLHRSTQSAHRPVSTHRKAVPSPVCCDERNILYLPY